MKPTTIILLFASLIWIIGGTALLSSWVCGASGFGVDSELTNLPPFSISDGSFQVGSTDHFSFGFGSSEPTIGESTQTALQDLATYLSNSPNKQLILTGAFTAEEENTTRYENLGLARAMSLKALLVEMGALGENILPQSTPVERSDFVKDVLYDGVGFSFATLAGDGGENAGEVEVEKISLAEGFVIPYDSDDYNVRLYPELQAWVENAKIYIEENPGSRIVVTGHTDNTGSRENNMAIAENRAKKVRRLLRNNGIGSGQVIAVSKGSDDPIASNYDDAGRRENRRVVLSIE